MNQRPETQALPVLVTAPASGELVAWLKPLGQAIQAGEPLFKWRNDGDDSTVAAATDGVVRHWFALPGDLLQPGRPLALIAAPETGLTQVLAKVISWLPDGTQTPETEFASGLMPGYPSDQSMHRRFEAMTVAAPHAPCLRFQGETLDYRTVNARANQLAHKLIQAGVKPGMTVGIFVSRSSGMVIGLLAILKAGGIYVPLDPDNPTARLNYLIEDSAVPFILCQSALQEQLHRFDAEPILIDADTGDFAEENLPFSGSGGHAAYIIYTSGSTGNPKGVVIPHRGVLRLCVSSDFLPVRPTDNLCQGSVATFDAATMEIWGALLNGAQLTIAPKDIFLTADQLMAFQQREKISIIFLTTGLFNQFASQKPELLNGTRLVMTGGEAMAPNWAGTILEQSKVPALLNLYGPTENTAISTFHKVTPQACHAGNVPIGKPIANSSAVVMDAHLKPAPLGTSGELCLGGGGLASGYWQRPGLTAEKFVPSPLGQTPGERLYRSGDLVRRNEDGNLAFLGRIDQQIKLRGFRIELGEIEEVLRKLPGVANAAVKAFTDDVFGTRLAAFLVAGDGSELDPNQVRDDLRKSLPSYMIPNHFQILEHLPLKVSGKVDRDKLQAPDWSDLPQIDYVAPRDRDEARIAAICSEILGRPEIGVETSLFDLGVHSLLATKILRKIAGETGKALPFQAFFQNPTIAAIARNLSETGEQAAPLPAMETVKRDRPLPLSFAQQRLWFFDTMNPGSTVYNIFGALSLHGAVDANALEAALGALIARHESLRTRYRDIDGTAYQHIEEDVTTPFETHDLSQLGSVEAESTLKQLALETAQHVFDLGTAPLFKCVLVQLSQDKSALLYNLHHIIADGWSMAVFVDDLWSLYRRQLDPGLKPLVPLQHQYADYAQWQRTWLQGERLDRQRRYWLDRLGKKPPTLDLAYDHPRPGKAGYRGQTISFQWDEALSKATDAFSKAEGATLFMTLLAAYQTLLHRYSQQDRILVGTPIANRQNEAMQAMIGFFVNTLVMQTDFHAGMSFRELVSQVKQSSLAAFDHQDFPFEKLVEAIAPERDLSRNPIVQTVFAYQNAHQVDVDGLAIDRLLIDRGQSLFDLYLDMEEKDGILRGFFEFSTDLFEPATIQAMTGHLQTLMQSALAHPDRPLAQLPIQTRDEVSALLDFNPRPEPLGNFQSLQAMTAGQARQQPQAIAMREGGQTLTYGDLNRRANQLAHKLLAQGIGAEDLVGTFFARGIHKAIAELAVLKTGAGFLPLDPAHPNERIAFMLSDVAAKALISTRDLATRIEEWQKPVLFLDSQTIEDGDPGDPHDVSTPQSLALVIYTSGSTGRPKGVQLTQGSFFAFCHWQEHQFQMGPGKRWAAISGPAFDAGTWDTQVNFALGAEVVVIDEAARLDPAALWRWFAAHRIDTAFCATPLAEALIQEHQAFAGYPKRLLGGGDRLRRRPEPGVSFEFINVYGPTETTILACGGTVTSEPADHLPTIGKTNDYDLIYIVDPLLQPQPVGVTGEMLIGGAGVSRGYFGQPALTAAKFVPNPFTSEPGARAYRTGDLARFLANGEIDFAGRTDFQVQIRGIRMELGEIEASLNRHASVRDSLVLAVENSEGALTLVAYIVAEGTVPAADTLIEFLSQSLPSQAVPKVFMFMDAFPTNANGKVDRKALPKPDTGLAEETYTPPQTGDEHTMAAIWAETLEKDRIGIHDNFFYCGGHSLLVAKVLARVRQQMGLDLPIRSLFEHPTIAQLLRHASGKEKAGEIQIPRVDRSEALPLSFAQQRLWFLDRLDPESAAYNIPIAFRMVGPLNGPALSQALEGLLNRHEALRTAFFTEDDRPVQRIVDNVALPLTIHDLGDTAPEAYESRAVAILDAEAGTPFDLSEAPLCRFTLIHGPEQTHHLGLSFHHIVADGWSMGLITRDLDRFYQAFAKGAQPQTEPEPIQYADYAVWQHQWLKGQRLDEQMAYWREQLGDGPPPLDLPTDRQRPSHPGHRGAMLALDLPAHLRQPLRDLAHREGATPFMVFLALFKVMLYHHAGQADLCVGTPIANRNVTELENLVGFFVNTLVLRSDLSQTPAFRECLAQVRQTTLDAFANSDMPFEKLVATLNPDRQSGNNPFFQVMFSYQSDANLQLQLGALEVAPVMTDRRKVHFDLTFDIEDSASSFVATLEYDTDLFDEATMRRWGAHFVQLLEAVLENPEARISYLQCMGPQERKQLLQEWNPQERFEPGFTTLVQGFEAVAAAQPSAEALLFEDRVLRYGELDKLANRLAHALHTKGVRAGDFVGVCMPRKPELVASLLAIFKIGAAYVPLDPAYPTERVAFMLEDTEPALVMSLAGAARPFEHHAKDLLDLDQLDFTSLPDTPPPAPPHDGDRIAYLIFTSGSTGRPKGVAIPHKAAIALLDWARVHFSEEERARVLGTTSICFDLSVFEIFLPLTSGDGLVWMDSILELPSHSKAETVTLINTVPSAMAELVNWDAIPPSVKAINLAGEALQPSLVEKIYARPNALRVVNLYGPSEDTTYSTFATIPKGQQQMPPIGRPVRGTQAHVCNHLGHLVPIGIRGELLLGGQGLAYGYWRRPGLTAARFVPNPYATREGERLYRTGDLVRYRANGELDFLGRIDHQVKFRGFRIELGEIEARLMDHPSVQNAVATVLRAENGDQRLAGYIQVGSEGLPQKDQILAACRDHLSAELPEYMVPGEMLALETLPLRPNGKVNRDALPDPQKAEHQQSRQDEPRTPLEASLKEVWQKLLKVRELGIYDRFFDLGDDWSAIRLLAQIQERFGVQIPLKSFCDLPTIAGLSETIEVARRIATQGQLATPNLNDDWEDGEI